MIEEFALPPELEGLTLRLDFTPDQAAYINRWYQEEGADGVALRRFVKRYIIRTSLANRSAYIRDQVVEQSAIVQDDTSTKVEENRLAASDEERRITQGDL